jgi:lipoprotein signal peptidase
MTATRKPLWSLIVILVLSVGVDQGTKYWAQHTLLDSRFFERTDEYPACGAPKEQLTRELFVRRHREIIPVVEGYFRFRYVENCAAAFGLGGSIPESLRFPFYLVVSVLAVAFIPYLYLKTPAEQRLMLYALPFVLGGAIGNLLDRLIFRYVIDFIEWYVMIDGRAARWPTFNVADAVIVVGIGLMMIQMFWRGSQEEKVKSEETEPEGETAAS